MNPQPSLFDVPVHRDAGPTERKAAKKTQCVSEQRRQAILNEARWMKHWGITRAEADRLLGTTPNVTQPRLAELSGYGDRSDRVRDGRGEGGVIGLLNYFNSGYMIRLVPEDK